MKNSSGISSHASHFALYPLPKDTATVVLTFFEFIPNFKHAACVALPLFRSTISTRILYFPLPFFGANIPPFPPHLLTSNHAPFSFVSSQTHIPCRLTPSHSLSPFTYHHTCLLSDIRKCHSCPSSWVPPSITIFLIIPLFPISKTPNHHTPMDQNKTL